MNPVEYAKLIVAKRGKVEAARIVKDCKRAIDNAMLEINPIHWGTPFSDEVTISEHTEYQNGKTVTRSYTNVDHIKKAFRMTKTARYWQNVIAYMKKRFPEEFETVK